LPWLYAAIPAHIACGVRVGTCQIGIPAAGDAVVDIGPADTPAIDGRRTCIGDLNTGCRSRPPVVGDFVLATGGLRRGGVRCKKAGAQH
jgi:hypothetical protein